MGMMDGYGYGMGYGYGIFGFVISILIIVGLVLVIKYLWEHAGVGMKEESALEILKRRYARGEISKEEFEEKKKDL